MQPTLSPNSFQVATSLLPQPRAFSTFERQLARPTNADGSADRETGMRLATAGAMLTGAILLRKLPPRLPGDGLKTLLPADWKVWAKIILGILSIQNINQALDLKFPPWLGALQAVAVINPLVVGVSKNSLKQTAVMAPLVAAVVQGAATIQRQISKPMEEQWSVPPVLTKLGLSIGLGVLAMLTYPKFYRGIASTGIIGKDLKAQAATQGSAFAGAAFATCVRGCSPGSFICLSEMADIAGSFTHWFRSHVPGGSPSDAAKSSLSPSTRLSRSNLS